MLVSGSHNHNQNNNNSWITGPQGSWGNGVYGAYQAPRSSSIVNPGSRIWHTAFGDNNERVWIVAGLHPDGGYLNDGTPHTTH